jgi:hypothetical protein
MRGKSNVIKRNVEKVWGARYTLGAHYLLKNMVAANNVISECTNLFMSDFDELCILSFYTFL